MSKTPEEIAEEYCNQFSWNDPREEDAHDAFLAGYKRVKSILSISSKMWVDPIGPQYRWISVKDRLPEIGEDKHNNHPHIYKYDQSERVLVLFRDCDIDDERVCIGRFISVLRDIESSRPEQWVECDEAGSAELKDIVAWMPLPAAPREEA